MRIIFSRHFRKFPFLLLLFAIIFALPVFAQVDRTLSLDEALWTLGSTGAGTAELRWDPFFASGTFVVGEYEAAFTSGRAGETGFVLVNRRDILTLPLPYMERGSIIFPEPFITQVKNTFSSYDGGGPRIVEHSPGQAHASESSSLNAASSAPAADSRFRIAAIIIDSGHGGRDPGASRTHTIQGKTFNSVEKEIVLKVGREVYASLTAAYPDKRILLTRTGDTNPSLDERVELANSVPLAENEAAIFISIHGNGSTNTSARGYEVWYLSPGYRRQVLDRSGYTVPEEVLPILNHMLEEELTTESVLIANSILRRLEEAVGRQTVSRGLKAEEWFVVRNARMPAVLVELGFVSNEADALLMREDMYLKKLSDALYKGISDFVALFERS